MSPDFCWDLPAHGISSLNPGVMETLGNDVGQFEKNGLNPICRRRNREDFFV